MSRNDTDTAKQRASKRQDQGQDPRADQHKEDDDGQQEDRSPAEWVSFGISLAVLLIVVGLLGYEHFTRGSAPPALAVQPRLQEVRHEGDRYYLPVEVMNTGDGTAGDVLVEVTLAAPGQDEEQAEFTILFLAGGQRTTGTVILQGDPTQGDLQAEVHSYTTP
jgi:uncharacterized protein (TIGR02588 family)